MNPHVSQPTSLKSLIKSYWEHRQLIAQMAWRDIVGRYKGSVVGLLWSFIIPVLMLAVYTFVFSVVFKAKWGGIEGESKIVFALLLFIGLTIHSLLGEVLNRAPTLIVANINYVKKVVFPIEILPAVNFFSAFFHTVINFVIILVSLYVLNGFLHWTIIFIPVILLPFCILLLGLSFLLASLGVFIRDINLTVGILTTIMLFLAPIFFPMSALPEAYQPYIMLNPISFIIIQTREVIINGGTPDWTGLGLYSLISVMVLWVGYVWFQKTRKGFADVL